MADQVWYTANPICKGLDVYPKWASRELTRAYASFLEQPEVHANQVYHFGDRFFGATVRFFVNGCHQQTTTSGGLRSVSFKELDPDDSNTLGAWVAHTASSWGGGYRLVAGEHAFGPTSEAMSTEPAAYIEIDIPQEYRSDDAEHQKVAFWEWCLATPDRLQTLVGDGTYGASMTLKRLPVQHWMAYDPETMEQLESAWQTGDTETTIQIGIRCYKVTFESNRVWARQGDVVDSARVRVVRRNPNMSPHEIQQRQEAAAARQAKAEQGAVCGICLDEFGGAIGVVALGKQGVDSPTTGCCHVFHSPCMHAQVVHTIRTSYGEPVHQCPLCRAEFSTHEYEEWTGEKVTMPTLGTGGR